MKWIAFVMWSAAGLFAQAEIHPDLDGFRYPALGRAAQIQGTVRFMVVPAEITLIFGHPILVPMAKDNLKKWARPAAGQCLLADYNFSISSDFPPRDTKVVEELIGDAFDRFFLRLLRRPVTRKTKEDIYRDPLQKLNYRVKPSENGCAVIEINVVTEPALLETSNTVLARR